MLKLIQKTTFSVTDMAARTGMFVALLVTIGAFAPYIYLGEQVASLRPYWLLGILPAAAWFLWRKSIPWAVLAMVLAVVQASPMVMAEFPIDGLKSNSSVSATTAQNAQTHDLRVLVINAFISNRDQTTFARLARDTRADVVMVSELDESLAKALAADYPYNTSHLGGVFGMGIFSRFPLSDIQVHTDAPFDAPRIHAKIGDTSVILVHPLPPVTQAALEGRNALIEAVAGEVERTNNPIIVAGDFNTTTWSTHLAPLHRVATRATSAGTFPTGLPLRIPIDHLFFKGLSQSAVFEFTEDYGSDHVPFIVVLRANEVFAGPSLKNS